MKWTAVLAASVAGGCGPSMDDLARLLDENEALRKKLALPSGVAIAPVPMEVITAPAPSTSCLPLEPPAELVPLGKAIETRSYVITATSAAPCGKPDAEGKTLYGVEILVEAREKSVSISGAEVQDDKSYTYTPVIPFYETCGPRLNDRSLEKGDKVRGYLHFVLPATAQGKTMKLNVRLKSFSKSQTVRFGLEK